MSVKPTVGVTPGPDVADSHARMIDAEPILTRKINAMAFAEFGEAAKRYSAKGLQKDDGIPSS